MKHLLLQLISVWVFLPAVNAQDFIYSFKVEEVKFAGVGSISIREDSNCKVYNIANWRSSGLRQPAGYASGNALSASAKFEIICSEKPDSVWIRGFGQDTINLPSKVARLTSDSGRLTYNYPLTVAGKKFPTGVVNYYDSFGIRWEVSLDNGLHWNVIDTTKHKLYVTKSAPMPENPYYLHFHTLLELSCKNAKGQSTDSAIINTCFEEFTDNVVQNYKGQNFTYYAKSPYFGANSLRELFQQLDGVCYSFAEFFIAMVKIQGISRTNNYINFYAGICPYPCGYAGGLFVKNWNFGTKSDSLSCPGFPYVFATDVTNVLGAAGVGNPEPLGTIFANHQIAKLDGVYYDACYGIKAKSMTEYKTMAMAGWLLYDTAAGIQRATTDMTKCDFTETIETY